MSANGKSSRLNQIHKFYCQTRRMERKGELIWTFEGLTNEDLFQNAVKVTKSPTFCVPGSEREFRVQLQTTSKGTIEEGHVGLFLLNLKGTDRFVSCEFSFVDIFGNKQFRKVLSRKLPINEPWGYDRFITRKELLDENLKLNCNNVATVCCVVSQWEEPKISNLHYRPLHIQNTDSTEDGSSLPEEWRRFFEQKLNTDIVLKVADKEFAAHKSVLMCRSPVFAAMLQHDMLEKRSNEVVIHGVECDVFDELLRYMYTDDFSRRSVGLVAKLLLAADKYVLWSLKSRCSDYLCDNAAPHNVLEILKTTELCRSEELDQRCLSLVESDMFSTTSIIDCMMKMPDLPEILGLLKRCFVDEVGQTD